MSDTVSNAAIAFALEGSGPQFLPLPDSVLPTLGAAHIPGAVHVDPDPSGLIVEFRTLSPDLHSTLPAVPPVEPSPSVSGYAALPMEHYPVIVAGALQFDL